MFVFGFTTLLPQIWIFALVRMADRGRFAGPFLNYTPALEALLFCLDNLPRLVWQRLFSYVVELFSYVVVFNLKGKSPAQLSLFLDSWFSC